MAADNAKPEYSKTLCPCGLTNQFNQQRIPRNVIAKTILFWLPLKRYKCYHCNKNKWVIE
ncbi:MAG: hypothetical protein ABIR72_09480 [Mucilaginibacter sp.]